MNAAVMCKMVGVGVVDVSAKLAVVLLEDVSLLEDVA